MCAPCRQAGDLIVRARESLLKSDAANLLGASKTFHEECSYPHSCTCQHVVRTDVLHWDAA
jgi:hypothetical protein